MTNETREQIKKDAWAASMQQSGSSTPCYEKGYQAGATHQHSISFEQGRKDAINNAIAIAMEFREAFETYARHNELIQQLESLRNERA